MKQLLTLIALVAISLMASAQSKPLVTLSHEGQLTLFESVSALKESIDAAVDGDIIYLSEGNFVGATNNSSLKIIDKKISIIGCGYKSHIVNDIEFHFSSSTTLTAPLLDGVSVEKLTISNNGVSSSIVVDQIEIKKCKINSFDMGGTPNNVTFDRCYINSFEGSSSHYAQFYNCKINVFHGRCSEMVNNCNIYYCRSNASYITNSIVRFQTIINEHGALENCIVFGNNTPNTILRNCYNLTNTVGNIFDDNLECTIEDMTPYVGTDGTVVGIYGGEWMPFSETPSVPTVDSFKSSVTFDQEAKKLNVTITVAPN